MANNKQLNIIENFVRATGEFLTLAETTIAPRGNHGEAVVAAKRLHRLLNSLVTDRKLSPKAGFEDHAPLIEAGTARIETLTRLLGTIDLMVPFEGKPFDDLAFGNELQEKGLEHAVKLLTALTADPTQLGGAELALFMPHLGLSLPSWEDILKWLLKQILMLILGILVIYEWISFEQFLQAIALLGAYDEAADSQTATAPEPPAPSGQTPRPGGGTVSGGDQNTVVVLPDGTVIVVTPGGHTVTIKPDGSSTTTSPPAPAPPRPTPTEHEPPTGSLTEQRTLQVCTPYFVDVPFGYRFKVEHSGSDTSPMPEIEVFEQTRDGGWEQKPTLRPGQNHRGYGPTKIKLHAKSENGRGSARVTITIEREG